MSDTVAAGKLRAFIERVERIEDDIAALNSDKSEIYKEIRGEGYDVKTVRKIVAKRKLDSFEREEQDALFDLYWNALHNGSSRVHVHEDNEQAAAKSAAKGSVPGIGFFSSSDRHGADESPVANSLSNERPEGQPMASLEPHEMDRHAVTAGETATNSPSAALTPEQLSAPEVAPPSASGATIPEHVPSFLIQKKTAADYRPNCLKPDACGASGLQHCYSCRKAMEAGEVAA